MYHPKILDATMSTWNKFHTENPKILRATVKNLVASSHLRPGLQYPALADRKLHRYQEEL